MTTKKNYQEKKEATDVDRRNFLKTAAVSGIGTALLSGTPNGILKAAGITPVESEQSTCPPILTKQRSLGTGANSMKVAEISLGCMGMVGGRGEHPDRKAMIQLIQDAYDRGVTYFDTANGYGPYINEEMLGEAIKPFRKHVSIGTKFSGLFENGKLIRDNNPQLIRKSCEDSLKRLDIEAIDLYYMHRNDKKTPMEDVAGTIKDLIKEGKVKHFGMCEVGPDTIRRAHAVQPVTAIQSEYSLMFRTPETVVFPTLEELGIGFLAYSPIGRGFLGGTVTEYTNFNSAKDSRGSSPRFKPEALRRNLAFVEVLNEYGRTRGMTSSQVSLAWMLAKYPFIVPLPGTTKLSHLEEDLRASELILTLAEVEELENLLLATPIVGDRYEGTNLSDVEY